MAAPQTHFVVTWVLLRTYLYKRGLVLYSLEGIVTSIFAFVFGFLIDIDHFLGAPKSYKEDLKGRLKKILKMQGAPPVKGVDFPIDWLHGWLGLILAFLWGAFLYGFFPNLISFFIPFVFWFVHRIIDKFQENNELSPYYHSFWYPFNQKKYVRKWGYPIKSQAEIIVSNVSFVLIVFFEIVYFLIFIIWSGYGFCNRKTRFFLYKICDIIFLWRSFMI